MSLSEGKRGPKGQIEEGGGERTNMSGLRAVIQYCSQINLSVGRLDRHGALGTWGLQPGTQPRWRLATPDAGFHKSL